MSKAKIQSKSQRTRGDYVGIYFHLKQHFYGREDPGNVVEYENVSQAELAQGFRQGERSYMSFKLRYLLNPMKT